MAVNFTARHFSITPEIKKQCERRIKNIEKLLGYPVEVNLILSVEKYRHKVDIKVKTKGMILNDVEETRDMLSSLGIAFDNIEKRVKKEKEKFRERKRRKIKEMAGFSASPDEEDTEKKVIRSENYSLKPMSIEEALMLFESGTKEVFVFRNVDSEKWAVLYRRKDGHYGLVEPG